MVKWQFAAVEWSHSKYFYLSWNFHILSHLENRSQRVDKVLLLYLSHIQAALFFCKLTPLNWSKPIFTKQSKQLSGRTETILQGIVGLWLCQHTEFHIYVQSGFAHNLHIEWLRINFTVGECSLQRNCFCSILSCWSWYPCLFHTKQDLYHWTNPHHPVILIKIIWPLN